MHTLKQATISSSCSKWYMQSQLPMCKMGKFWLNLLGIKRILRLDENLVTGPNDLRDQMGLSISHTISGRKSSSTFGVTSSDRDLTILQGCLVIYWGGRRLRLTSTH